MPESNSWALHSGRGGREREAAKTGIDFTNLQSPDKRIPLGQYLLLWELAISATQDPALRLHLPKYYSQGQYHFVPSIILSSATLLDGLKQWIRYGSLVCDADKFELFSAKVSLSIIEYLPRNQADIQTIADSFHMDRRTLLRKLKVEGTTFKDLLEDTRKKLAHNYLVEAFSITQISFMLGFSATSSFQVAFKRWYNQSPGDYRRDHL